MVGEISNARLAPSSHLYFTLKDSRSAINGVMFKSAFQRMRFKVVDRMEVIVRGRVQVFEQRGALQLYAEEMGPRGVGALQVAFEQLKRRLDSRTVRSCAQTRDALHAATDRNRDGDWRRGLRDMLGILFDRFPSVQVIFRPAKVQGDGSAQEIADAIADLNRDGRAEVLIVGRGGGSLEDLWAFNEEVGARAIFRSLIPVISAVGHEVDYTIADFVADLRAPTPTAAAQMVVPSLAELKERVESLGASLASVMGRELSGRRESVDDLAERMRHPGASWPRRANAWPASTLNSATRCRRESRMGGAVCANYVCACAVPTLTCATCGCGRGSFATILLMGSRRLWKPNGVNSVQTRVCSTRCRR